jgi:hypothetical protein
MYQNGRGVAKDDRLAVEWYRKAAEQGSAIGQSNLGFMYKNGAGGVMQDHTAAAQLFESAARQGEPYGQRNLGLALRDGLGVKPDVVGAYAWLNLAASHASAPHPDAAEERDQLAQDMTKDQLAEGQRLAREWKVGASLGSSKLKPVAPKKVAGARQGRESPTTEPAANDPFPARPAAQPGLTTCNTRCLNGDCYRTYGDGRKVRFQAQQKWNPFNNKFEWDSGGC